MTYCTPSVREIPVVTVEDPIDSKAARVLQRRVAIALGSGRTFVVIDLSAITIEDRQAIDLLCDALRRVDRHEGRLALAAAPPAVRGGLERSVIDGVELYPTLGAARAAASLGQGRGEATTNAPAWASRRLRARGVAGHAYPDLRARPPSGVQSAGRETSSV